jgi:hypothetical protein
MDHFGDVRYFDRFGLVTRDFVDCRISAQVSRSSWGLIQLVGAYLRQADAFERECGIPRPDLIYEIYGESLPPMLEQTLHDRGYRIVSLQGGVVDEGSRLFPGNTNVGHIYVAALQDPGADEARLPLDVTR